MPLKRTELVVYAVVLREHPEAVKIGRTTKWRSRRRAYDCWNFAQGDGVLACAVYCITEEYADLAMIEKAVLNGMAMTCPAFSGSEWFKATLERARATIESVLVDAGVSFTEAPARLRLAA